MTAKGPPGSAPDRSPGLDAQVLHFLLEHAPVVLWTVDAQMRVTSVEGAGLRAMGIRPEQNVGRPLADILGRERAPRGVERHRQALRGEAVSYETEWNGRILQCEIRPLRDPAGQVVGCLGMTLDVTAQRQSEQSRQLSEERLRQVVESNMIGILFWDQAGQIIDANDAFLHLLGYTRDDLRAGRIDWRRVTPPEHLHLDEKGLEEIRRTGRCTPFEKEYFHKDGSRVPVLVGGAALSGRTDEGVAFVHDRRETRRLEEQFRQAQKMEALGRLAGGVAHDFNNLLTIIASCGELLLAGLPEGDARGLVREIQNAQQRAASLTRQLLTFSRRSVLEPQVIDLNALLADTEQMLRRLLGEGVRLETRFAPELGPVRADAGQLVQAVLNLAVNARDAMPDGGRLVLETRDAQLGRESARQHPEVRPGRYVELSVADDGSGMDEATKARMFEPFFTTKGPGKGTGLGLAMVYGFVRQSGGHIAVDSAPGQGTAVRIFLPIVH